MWGHIPVTARTQTTEAGGLRDQSQFELQQDPEKKKRKKGRKEARRKKIKKGKRKKQGRKKSLMEYIHISLLRVFREPLLES